MPVAGATPSVIRAAVMYLIAAAGFILRRETNAMISLMAALALLLLCNPFAVFSLSLQLSFAATLGLLLFASTMQHRLSAPFAECSRLIAVPVGAVTCTVCASVFTLPISLATFGRASLLSLIANLPAAPLAGVCFVLGYLLCAVSAVFPALVPLFAVPLRLLLRFLLILAERIASLPFGSVDATRSLSLAALALAGAAVLVWLTVGSHVRWRIVLPLVCCAVIGLFTADTVIRAGEYRITCLPCGSGQAIILSDTRGHMTLIDCAGAGSARNAAALTHEWMRLNGQHRIDTLILTAVDQGHARDLPALLDKVKVGRILVPSGVPQSAKNAELLTLCQQYSAEEISREQTLTDSAAPVSVFPVTAGKLGVCIADRLLVLHSATPKQLEIYFSETRDLPRADELVLSQSAFGAEKTLTGALHLMQTRNILIAARNEDFTLQYGDVSCESTYLSGEIVRRYKKE